MGVEVLPDVTNTTSSSATNDSPKVRSPESHADGFSVKQVKGQAVEPEASRPRVQLEEEIDDSNHKLILDVFGFEIHRMLCATAWDDRAQALASARAMCE